MNCSNCYTGCTNTYPDKCVKYTGNSNAVLGITTGDSLAFVEQQLFLFLESCLDSSGIKVPVAPGDLCSIVSANIADPDDIGLPEVITALVKSACQLDLSIITQKDRIDTIEDSYTLGCLTGVGVNDGTHAILQAVITKLCTVDSSLTALSLDLSTNYVKIADIDTYIADYITNNLEGGGGTLLATKMVPYTAVEYYGSVSYFDATGAGIGDWANIYLCNGNNGTPDKRGRIAVGTTTGMGGGAFNSAVNPAISGNPTYSLYTTAGSNTVTLTTAQIPSHSHTGTASSVSGHFHYIANTQVGTNNSDPVISSTTYMKRALAESSVSQNYTLMGSSTIPTIGKTSTDGDHSHTLTIDNFGGGGSHSNIQPVLACHYIMYIPAP